ncbi:helix-turn-helix transcriptional regulator [Aerococcaceae bacterium NML210727]|nr:helix-turn-helix transcriptional regulator [Aerococcaceae bacterium NML210727]MCW6655055.1 helix-turn-helix transcriptional regulator [Aerococcaceae bacterium NML201296]
MLKKLRKQYGLTQDQLAQTLDISPSYYVKIENDFMKPSYKVLKKLKEFYGDEIDLNELVK